VLNRRGTCHRALPIRLGDGLGGAKGSAKLEPAGCSKKGVTAGEQSLGGTEGKIVGTVSGSVPGKGCSNGSVSQVQERGVEVKGLVGHEQTQPGSRNHFSHSLAPIGGGRRTGHRSAKSGEVPRPVVTASAARKGSTCRSHSRGKRKGSIA